MRINHNISAMVAYRHLNDTNANLSKSLERLSSGFRINRAADDAAGLAISEKLRMQISGLEIAAMNAQDGISIVQTAEGALERDHTILRRIRDLVELAANGDKSDADRAHYQDEINQLLDEIDRIANTTEYNRIKLLNGDIGGKAEIAGDVEEIAKSVSVQGTIRSPGEYEVKVLQEATQAVAYIGGHDAGGGGTIPTIDQAGGFSMFVNDSATGGAADGKYTFKVEMDEKTVSVELIAEDGAGDSMADVINKFNKAFEEAGMKAHAIYDESAYTNATPASVAAIKIIADEFGSAHDIHVDVINAPSTHSGWLRNIADPTNAQDFVLYDSDLRDATGSIKSDTTVQDFASADPWDTGISLGDISIQTADTTSGTITIAADDTIADIITKLDNFGGSNKIDASYDSDTGIITIKDLTKGSETFKIEDSGASYTASTLGIAGETKGDTIIGAPLSKTKDYILEITDPESNTAKVNARQGNKSTVFDAIDSTYNVVNTGYDPDGNGVKPMSTGGISGVAFTLNEVQATANDQFSIILSGKGSLTLQIGPSKNEANRMGISINAITTESLGIAGLDVSTQAKAQSVIDNEIIDNAIDVVSTARSELGAFQNRLNHSISNLTITQENLQAAESRIRDVDMAKEMMEFTRYQILGQAGTAMLGQANILPQMVLQLLG